MKGRSLWYTLYFGVLLLVWQLFYLYGGISPWMLPGPGQVMAALVDNLPLIGQHTLNTLAEALSGFGLALVVGFSIAVAMVLKPAVKSCLSPILVISQTIPIVTIYPLLMIWFGYGILPKILVVALVCFFPIVVSVVDGMEGADSDLAEWMTVMGANAWTILWKLRVPWALPQLFSGLKVAATYSVMGAVIGEWMGASQGLGVYINRSANSFMVDRVFAAILIIVVLSLALYAIIEGTARASMPWVKGNNKEEVK